MNVKISEHAVTFKITEQEMGLLLEGTAVEKRVRMGTADFTMMVAPTRPIDSRIAPLQLILDRSECRLMLSTPSEEVRKLADMGRDREGLHTHIDGVDVFLQVDIRSDTRPKRAFSP